MQMIRSKLLVVMLLLAFSIASGSAQQPCRIVFYNVENLFDPYNDPLTADDAFTPSGSMRWTAARYARKCARIGRVLGDIAAPDGEFPTLIGLAEVENRGVVADIAATEPLAGAGYALVHFDSPDERGIDVALLFRPDRFVLEGCQAVRTEVPQLPHFRTRDILTVWGTIDREPFFVVVSHWPSRLGGQQASEFKRLAVGAQIRRLADSVATRCPATKIVIMGDFNDDPTDPSVTDALGAGYEPDETSEGGLFNPFAALFRAGEGTLAYNRVWNLFDQIVVSANLTADTAAGYRLQRDAATGRSGAVFRPDYLLQSEGDYRGSPRRTYVGNRYTDGYSDHLPVYINLIK